MKFNVSDVFNFIGSDLEFLNFKNREITGFAPIDKATEDEISFCVFEGAKALFMIAKSKAGMIVCHSSLESGFPKEFESNLVFSQNPRLTFSKIANHFNKPKSSSLAFNKERDSSIHPSAQIVNTVRIGKNPHIEANVIIYDGVEIGNNCIIRAGAILGTLGFGFEREMNGENFRFPQLGSLLIGNNVEIGYNCTIDRGTLDKTIIEDGVKIDNFVHIGHNCKIGKNSLITAYNIFSGGVVVGEGVYIAPGCCFRDYVKIGKNALVGIGSLVLKDVPDNVTVYGRPAKIKKLE